MIPEGFLTKIFHYSPQII